MASTTTLFRARVPAKRLKAAERILDQLGLKPGDAFNMLLAQIELRKGLPFEVSTQLAPTLSSDEQAAAWTEALGAY
jgi:addiction module RelB/DinJ family antitoxin